MYSVGVAVACIETLISFAPCSLVSPLRFVRSFLVRFRLDALRAFQRRKRRRVRVTLLVNVWLSHRPDGVSPLPAALAASLSRSSGPGAPPRPRFDLPVAFSPVPAEENMTDAKKRKETPSRQEKADGMVSARETGGSAVVIREPLGPTLLLELRAPAPDRLSAGDLKALHSFTLVCGAGSSSRISTRHEERAGGAACVDGAARAGGGSGTDRGFVGQEVAGGGEGADDVHLTACYSCYLQQTYFVGVSGGRAGNLLIALYSQVWLRVWKGRLTVYA